MERFLIDNNLPKRFHLWKGPEFIHQSSIDIKELDFNIWKFAAENSLTIITKDVDFYNLALSQSNGPKVVHIKFGNLRMREFYHCMTLMWPNILLMLKEYRLLDVYSDKIIAIA